MKYRYLRLQSQLHQLRGQHSEASSVLCDAVKLAIEGYGEDSIQAYRARLDQEACRNSEFSVALPRIVVSWGLDAAMGMTSGGCDRFRARCSDEYNLMD